MEKEKKTIRSFQRILNLENSKVKEIKVRIAKTIRLIQQCQQEIDEIDQRIEKERECVSHDLELKKVFSAFLDRSKHQKDKINQKLLSLNQELESLFEELKEASATAKGYEKIIEVKRDIVQKKMDHLEQQHMDEIAIKNFNK